MSRNDLIAACAIAAMLLVGMLTNSYLNHQCKIEALKAGVTKGDEVVRMCGR